MDNYQKERELVQTISFRTQNFFIETAKKFSEFLFETSYSTTARTIFEIGTFHTIARIIKLSSRERTVISYDYFNFDTLSTKYPIIPKTIQLLSELITTIKHDIPKSEIKSMWKITYEILEKILNLIIIDFKEEILKSFLEKIEATTYSESLRRKITKHIPLNEEEKKTIEQILLFGITNLDAILEKLHAERTNSKKISLNSLKLWLLLCIASLIKISILVENTKSEILKKRIKLTLRDIHSTLRKVKVTFDQ